MQEFKVPTVNTGKLGTEDDSQTALNDSKLETLSDSIASLCESENEESDSALENAHRNLYDAINAENPLPTSSTEIVTSTPSSTKCMQSDFRKLVNCIVGSMTTSITVDRLLVHLGLMVSLEPVLVTSEDNSCLFFGKNTIEELRTQCENIEQVVQKLQGYYSWFNYDLIKEFATTFCEDDRKVKRNFKSITIQ